jgi:hypothetical protein
MRRQVSISEYPDYARAILTAAQAIVAEFQWKHGTYVLCANGGPRQEVQQVHFHLFFGASPLHKPLSESSSELVQRSGVIKTVRYPQPDGRLHLALILQDRKQVEGEQEVALVSRNSLLTTLLDALPSLNAQFHLVERGYTFLMHDVENDNRSNIGGHIVAGTMREEANS